MARFATIEYAGSKHGVSHYTIRNNIKQGKFPVYKLPGERGACVDMDEVDAYYARHPAKVRDYATFGPDATVRDLTSVAATYEVLR